MKKILLTSVIFFIEYSNHTAQDALIIQKKELGFVELMDYWHQFISITEVGLCSVLWKYTLVGNLGSSFLIKEM